MHVASLSIPGSRSEEPSAHYILTASSHLSWYKGGEQTSGQKKNGRRQENRLLQGTAHGGKKEMKNKG